ncbi:hypothetical protein ACSBM8_04375 [Sphingomonas sp. ASY06-1R]|jgi:hypothetical protein|uniref:hypothetical protein n=1 Tax=Sphingomonas sp. ASY06-1R TaxID=3445771 RepID=UPI003FA2CD04
MQPIAPGFGTACRQKRFMSTPDEHAIRARRAAFNAVVAIAKQVEAAICGDPADDSSPCRALLTVREGNI